MSDLRTRIAAVLDAHRRIASSCECGFDLGVAAIVWHWQEHVADVVIAELGLIRDPFSTVAFFRYVTQWQPNEQFAPYCNRCGIPHTEPCRRPADA